jgi:chromatin segregation and condensation protein Rec8/ScpA/Scc1 (kleisin family)
LPPDLLPCLASTVAEIKTAMDHFTFEERCELMALLNPDDDWDREMRADAAAGKFDQLVDEAEAERRAGTLREISQILQGMTSKAPPGAKSL